MKKNVLPLIVLALMTIALAACAGGGTDNGGPDNGVIVDDVQSEGGGLPVSLEGTSWVLAGFGFENELPLAGTTLTLSFQDGQVGGSGGCNSFGGSYQVDGGNLIFGDLAMTLMACADNGINDQETRYLQLLGEVNSFAMEGSLLMLFTSSDEVLNFIPAK